jgi:CRISPR-associated protein Csm5
MNFLSSHTLHFTPLAPVHIGCNETYEPTNYVIEGDALYEFDSELAIQSLPEVAKKELLKIVSGKPSTEMLKQVQALFYQNRESLIAGAEHYFPVGQGVSELYTKRVGKAAQYEANGRQVVNNLEIERTSYNCVTRKPMFPGSSIKGAIRTALLDSLNEGKPSQRNERNRDFQERLFEGKFHTDPMRLISVSDAHWSGEGEIPGNEIRFAVNRKRRLQEGERLQQSMAEEKGLSQTLECIAAMQPRSLKGSLSIHDIGSISGHHKDLPKPKLRFSIQQIAKRCNSFYLKLFKEENEAMRKLGYLDEQWLAIVSNVFSEKTQQKLNNDQAFLLRVGRHSGAEAMTVKGVRSIKIMAGKGQQPKFKDAPQTWWLASTDKEKSLSSMPFGWILVEVDSDENDLLAGSKDMHDFNQNKISWLNESKAYKQGLEDILKLKLAEELERKKALALKKAEDEERARLEKVQAEEAREKREQELAKLNPIEREVVEYDSYLDAIKALSSGHWGDELVSEAAGYIRERMKSEKVWRESSSKKNPSKDKPYSRTKDVMEYLK